MSCYFDQPTQVLFWDNDNLQYQAGIAYRDEIICGCCGAIIPIQEVIDELPAEVLVPIYVFTGWLDMSEELCPTGYDFQHYAIPYGVDNDSDTLTPFYEIDN